MNDVTLKAFLRIFAIIRLHRTNDELVIDKNYIESFLSKQYSKKVVAEYLGLFDKYISDYQTKTKTERLKKESLFSVKILSEIEKLNKELSKKQKYVSILFLLEYINTNYTVTDRRKEDVKSLLKSIELVAESYHLDLSSYKAFMQFVFNEYFKIKDKSKLLVINSKDNSTISGVNHIKRKNFKGQLIFLNVPNANLFLFNYIGSHRYEMNQAIIFENKNYLFQAGRYIKGEGIAPVYYNEVLEEYVSSTVKQNIRFDADNIEFKFKNSENGIKQVSVSATSGQLIAIMGGSGVGKSTLFNILNGTLPLNSGNLYINGHNLHENLPELKPYLGYVPPDDLLHEELTVFQNLYYSARLSLGSLKKSEVVEVCHNMLQNLQLDTIKELKVGSSLNKLISGGQRKRLNIALELIREPSILLVDEPTSGLSSTDAILVMQLLKEQALKGKLVITNIHQPSIEVFNMFDKLLLLDKGGYTIYYDSPFEAFDYFKKHANKLETSQSNQNPDEILNIVEEREVDEIGEFTPIRKHDPLKWYNLFKEQHTGLLKVEKSRLPLRKSINQNVFKQYATYFSRNYYNKLQNTQYVLLTLLISPILAFLLAFLIKSKVMLGGDLVYLFGENDNIPPFLFMSCIVAVFVGLIISAEEILGDRKILKRESFLKLSIGSYLNSKISLLFIISVIQSISFVLVGNLILEIKGMFFLFWLVLFSTSCFANIVGLLISSLLRSVVAIYILVPFIVIPQILLSGALVEFDKLNPIIRSEKHVPLIGDLMIPRWSFEALMVAQFKNNEYQKNYFSLENKKSDYSYILYSQVPELKNQITLYQREISKGGSPNQSILELINNEINKLSSLIAFNSVETLRKEGLTEKMIKELYQYFKLIDRALSQEIEKIDNELYNAHNKLKKEKNGPEELTNFKNKHSNKEINAIVLRKRSFNAFLIYNNEIIRKSKPIYFEQKSKIGRAHFYASQKNVLNGFVPTYTFNILVIWGMVIISYLVLWMVLLKKKY